MEISFFPKQLRVLKFQIWKKPYNLTYLSSAKAKRG